MSLQKDEKKKQEEWKQFQKEELHKVSLSAFVKNGIEQDKVLLSLNIASIGFFANYLSKFEVLSKSDLMILSIVIIAMLSFLLSASLILTIFSQNKKYLMQLLKGNFSNDKLLSFLDTAKLVSFIVGVIFGIIFSIFTVIENSNLKENIMEESKKTVEPQKVNQKSLNELASHIAVPDDSKKTNESLNQLGSHIEGNSDSSQSDKKEGK